MILMWICGMATGYSIGTAQADSCTGWSGRYFQTSTCGGQTCSGFSFGPFFTTQCNDNYLPPPSSQVTP
jgi:hypothetical protein